MTTTTAAVRTAPRARPALAGVGTVLRLAVRRDRARLAVWTCAVCGLWTAMSAALQDVYPTVADRQARAALMSSPAAVVLTGPGYGTADYTHGAMVAGELALMMFVALAIMSIQTVVRHTRTEEETGRAELVRAGIVGRHAPFVAAFVLVVVVNAVIALGTAAGLVMSGLPPGGAFAVGLAGAGTGVVFGAVAAVAAQVVEHGRGATGLAIAMLGLAFVLRAAGDLQRPHGGPLSWLSPLGWAQQVRAFVDLRWWPLLLSLVLTLVLLLVAGALGRGRDLGAGLLRARPGSSRASRRLAGPFGLAWRLQRATIAAWACGVASFAIASGTFVDSVAEATAQMPALARALGGADGATEAFVALMVKFFALVVAGCCVAMASGARADEVDGHLELVLATSVARSRWMLARLAVVALAGVGLLVLAATGLWLGATITGSGSVGLGGHLLAGCAQVPAVAVLVGAVTCLFGWVPRLLPAMWAWYAYAFVASVYGGLLGLPAWALKVSPFEHVPSLPGGAPELQGVTLLAGVTAVLVGGGLGGLRRRDIPSH